MSEAKFMGENLFESGPFRFSVLPQGTLSIPRISFGQTQPGSIFIGPLEFTVLVRGRLVAADDVGLDGLLSVIIEKSQYPASAGTLVDAQGRQYPDMKLVRVTTGETLDRGASVSLSYELRFVRDVV